MSSSRPLRPSKLRKRLHLGLRKVLGALPSKLRFAIYRTLVDCDPAPDARLQLKIADSQEELEACFTLLHDAYVASGFMKPDPSGLRATKYHALPTTTTLCAKFDGRVVGTISMIREGVFGFPLQSIFDLEPLRAKGGQIAEISALAVHPDFRKTGGAILFPLMKFMHQYCVEYFDTRHLVIAVNPEKIELYEALLFFERLQEVPVANYDFANGAPAVGATLDLKYAESVFRRGYRGRPLRKNMHRYFFESELPNIQKPQRRYFTTNDPVMTPELLDYFFNRRTGAFDQLDDRHKSLLWAIYDAVEYRKVLPMLSGTAVEAHPLRRHQRYSIRAPATLSVVDCDGQIVTSPRDLKVIEISLSGFQAECGSVLPLDCQCSVTVQLGVKESAHVDAVVVREKATEQGARYYGFRLDEPDAAWRRCVASLEVGMTGGDLLA